MDVGQETRGRDIRKMEQLKAMLNYHKYKAAVIEEQLEIVEAQAAVKAALEESNAALV